MRLAVASVLLPLSLAVSAQTNDFQTWSSVEIKKKISKELSLSLEEEVRLGNNSTTFDKNNVTLSGTYALHKKLRIGAGYRYSCANNLGDGYAHGHRLMINATLRHKTESNIVLSFRERFQSDWSSEPQQYATLCLRHRLQAAYSKKDLPWSPYVNVEIFEALNNPVQNTIERIRAFAGCEYEISNSLNATLGFGYQCTRRPGKKPKDTYMLSAGLSYSL